MDITQQYFTCKKCGESKIWGDMVKSPACKNGIRYKCKKCNNASVDYGIIKANSQKYHKERLSAKYYPAALIGSSEMLLCLVCNSHKTADMFRPKIGRNDNVIGIVKECNGCAHDKKKKLAREYYGAQGRDRIKKNQRIYREKNKDAIYKNSAEWHRDSAKKISDFYTKRVLKKRGFTPEQIEQNPELINIQRIIIQTKRLCKT